MPDVTKDQRLERLASARAAAEATITRFEDLSNSNNSTVAANALSLAIDAKNVRDDLAVIQALIGNKPAGELKPVSDADLAELDALESKIDAQIRTNQILTAGLKIATEVVQAANSVGQILRETHIQPLAAATGLGEAPPSDG